MAKMPDVHRIKINLDISEESVQLGKGLLETWLNAKKGRNIIVREKYTEDGKRLYLEIVPSPFEAIHFKDVEKMVEDD